MAAVMYTLYKASEVCAEWLERTLSFILGMKKLIIIYWLLCYKSW